MEEVAGFRDGAGLTPHHHSDAPEYSIAILYQESLEGVVVALPRSLDQVGDRFFWHFHFLGYEPRSIRDMVDVRHRRYTIAGSGGV